MTRLRCMVCWTQQSTAFYCLFDSLTKKVNSTDVILGHLLLKITGKKLGKEEAQFNYFDRSYIWDFGNTQH